MSTDPVVILGGGLAGISAAMHVKQPFLLVEKASRLGGLARTTSKDGYFFDHTGHWLHLRNDYTKGLIEELLGDQVAKVARKARIYSHGCLTLYPFQANLHGLPAEVTYECLMGFIETLRNRSADADANDAPRNFEEYILHHFGAGIAKHFMIPYNHKLWGVHPREITSAWCSRFVPIPSPEQVVAGAVGSGPAQLGYNIHFLYPKQGGIETVTRALVSRLDAQSVKLSTWVESIDAQKRSLTIGPSGDTIKYDRLITSIPLPELVRRLVDAPKKVTEAAQQLRATAVHYLNVATSRPSPADYHWVYVPEERYPFYRVGVFSNAMPSMAPDGGSSLYVELSSREGQSPQRTGEALQALADIGVISSVEDVRFADYCVIDPAYVIFDDHYESAVSCIHDYLEHQGIRSGGRYGAWIYNAMEDSLLSGKQMAEDT